MFKKFKSKVKGVCSRAKSAVRHVKAGALALFLAVASPVVTFAQNAAGDYSAGTSALAKVTEEIAKYIPFVVKLCYAIAGVVAIVGAISVYIAMNNEEQDVKNILVLRNAFEKTRKQMKVNALSINALSDNLNFPMFAKLTLKKT